MKTLPDSEVFFYKITGIILVKKGYSYSTFSPYSFAPKMCESYNYNLKFCNCTDSKILNFVICA